MKNSNYISLIKKLFLLGTCFYFFILKCRSTYGDFTAFNFLKKHYIEDELQLRWDRQHISELESEMQSIKSEFDTSSQIFLRKKKELRQENLLLEKSIKDEAEYNSKLRSHQVSDMNIISEEMVESHVELNKEQTENIALKKVLEEMKGQIEENQKSLRGNQSSAIDANEGP
eukprot:CAMPEP_0181085078 /NCGR_PEP_ID=MMETSP1071-20121207/5042_1 /TAXON_ID=35127 /ORGANISM="Thalassiosira sp., Strain NH16" /LENGTH=171 /DNA_ID=CAMNT_0023166865 /DNA_START=63 /DNA_END=578 /DNA_ORIENTATION=-